MAEPKKESTHVLMTAESFLNICNLVDNLPTKDGAPFVAHLRNVIPITNPNLRQVEPEPESEG